MNHEDPHSAQQDHEPNREPTPGIWIGSLSDYTDGVLFGDWLDPARDEADVLADIQAMLEGSPKAARTGQPAEEWGIFDHDGFGPLRVDEYESLGYVTAVARGISEHGLGFAAWASIADRDELDDYEDRFIAHVESVDDYVADMVADLGYDDLLDEAVPASIRPYVQIDTQALARDMQLGGDITSVSDGQAGYWLFHNH